MGQASVIRTGIIMSGPQSFDSACIWTGKQLLAERFPDTSRLLLEDWERYLGLPECDMAGATSRSDSVMPEINTG